MFFSRNNMDKKVGKIVLRFYVILVNVRDVERRGLYIHEIVLYRLLSCSIFLGTILSILLSKIGRIFLPVGGLLCSLRFFLARQIHLEI